MLGRIRLSLMTATACAVVFVLSAVPARADGSGSGDRALSSHLLVGVPPNTALSVHVESQEIPGSPAVSSGYGILAFTFDDSGYPSGPLSVTIGEPPDVVISNVSAVDVTYSSAVITWSTNIPANSLVEYGETAAYGMQSPLYAAGVTEHSVAIGGLFPGTEYHFRAVSEDGFGGVAYSDDHVFETPLDPLVISDARVDSVGQTWAAVSWTTNRPGNSRVEYGETASYGSFTPLDPDRVTEHAVVITGLSPGTVYHMRALSEDGLGFSAASDDVQFGTVDEPLALDGVGVAAAGTTWATIVWTTNRPADSQVEYGPTAGYGSATPLDPALTTDHEVTIEGLEAGSLYHFRAASRDTGGWEAHSDDHEFTTESPPLAISEMTVSLVGPTWAVIDWLTDRPATSRVDYGETESYGWSASPGPELVTEHSTTLSGLAEGTLYHFRAVSADSLAVEAESPDSTFTTMTGQPTGPPIIDGVNVEETSATSVLISWTTDRPASSRVCYGTGGELDCSTAVDTLPVTDHSVIVWPVVPRVTYHFVVESGCATGSSTCPEMTFETSTPPGTDPQAKSVEIVRAYVAALTETSAVVRWATDRPCSSWVEYSRDDSYAYSVPAFPMGEFSYEAVLTGLVPETLYNYRVGAWDAPGGPTVSESDAFVTPGPEDNTPPAAPSDMACACSEGGVELTWARNTEPDLEGYLVYRARHRDDEVDWSGAVRLTADPIPDPWYFDSEVEEGANYSYVVTAVDRSENESSYSESVTAYIEGETVPKLQLAVFPNPVNPALDDARFVFTLPPGVSSATLRVMSLAGKVVCETTAGGRSPGEHTIAWNGRDSAGWPAGSGVYLCELRAGDAVARRKMALLRDR